MWGRVATPCPAIGGTCVNPRPLPPAFLHWVGGGPSTGQGTDGSPGRSGFAASVGVSDSPPAHPRTTQEAARAPSPRGQGEWRLSHLFGWAGVCSLPGLLLLCRTGGGAKCPWPQSAQICVTGGLGRGAGPGNGGSSAAPPRAPTPKTTVAETAEQLGAARAPGR